MLELCYEEILNENKKLKLSDLEKSCINTFEYLNLHHKINFLKIKIQQENEDKEIFFDNTDENCKFIESLSFTQNLTSKIFFEFYDYDEYNFKFIKEHLETLDFSLQIFSQSIFSKYMEKTIDKLSLIDHVTGVHNRVYLNNYAHTLLSLSKRENKKIAFVKVGIDQFKAVIDEFNYITGDKVLKNLANILTESVRESDLVIKITHDEFLIILQNVLNEENAMMIAQKLINNFANKETIVNDVTKQTLKKTICCGISIFPDNADNLNDLIKKSDIALYEAQNIGRSKVFQFTEETTQTVDFF